MLILAGTTQTIRLTRTSANAVDVMSMFADNTTTTFAGVTPVGLSLAAIATTAIVTSPAASTQRNVSHIRIFCRGGANTLTVDYFDGTTGFQAWSATFATGESAEYEHGKGWAFFDAAGNIKTTGVGSGRLLRAPQYLTSGTTISHPTGTGTIEVEGVGGGGAGGGTGIAVAQSIGGQGGSATWGRKTFTAGASSSTFALGAAGVGVAGANGGNGGNSTFTHNGTTMTLPGGLGGNFAAGAAAIGVISGGLNATAATNADISITGIGGGDAVRGTATGVPNFHVGPGGSNPLGKGAPSKSTATTQVVPPAPTGFGAGGGGILNGTTLANTAGVNGGPSVFIVREYT